MSMDPSSVLLTDRVAVVTGGGAGIGRGIARGLAAFGASVAIWERDAETAASAAQEVGGLGIATDVRDADEVDEALARTTAELGPVSILVNNAGGVFSSPILETSENGWDAPVPGQPQARHPVHPAGGPGHGRGGTGRQHHQRDLDRRCAGRARATPPTPRPRPASSTSPRRPPWSSPPTASGSTRWRPTSP